MNLFLLHFVFVGACFSLSHQLKKHVFSRNFSSRSSRLKSNHVGSHPLRESHDQDGITFFSDRDAIPKKPSESKLGEKLDGTRLIAVTIDSIDHSKFAIPQSPSMSSKTFAQFIRPCLEVTTVIVLWYLYRNRISLTIRHGHVSSFLLLCIRLEKSFLT